MSYNRFMNNPIIKIISLVLLWGLSGYFAFSVLFGYGLGGVELSPIISILWVAVFLISFSSAFWLIFGNRANKSRWVILLVWLLYILPLPASYVIEYVRGNPRRAELEIYWQENLTITLERYMERFKRYASNFPNDYPESFKSNSGYQTLCDPYYINLPMSLSHPDVHVENAINSHKDEVTGSYVYDDGYIYDKYERTIKVSDSETYKKGNIVCRSDYDGYALSIVFPSGEVRCVDSTGYFGPVGSVNTGPICSK